MGQPKLPRKKYDTPNHPWQGDRIKAEHELKKKYGLKSKTEIWKAQSELRSIRGQARGLISRGRNPDDHQAHRESKLLLQRLHRSGYVGDDASLNDVLALDVERILNRRLQSQVYLKGYARTPKQARQFVSHGLVMIGDRRVTVPSYVVRREEEEVLELRPDAAISNPDHPVRPKAPGAEVTAIEDRPAAPEANQGAAPTAPSAEPTGSAPPPQTEPEATVAPSEGEQAEAAKKEAAPGEAPPAEQVKEVPVEETAEPEAKPEETAEPEAAEAKPEETAEAETPEATEPAEKGDKEADA